MIEPETEGLSPALEATPAQETPALEEPERSNPALMEAARELQAAEHDAQVAFDCIALGELDRAHTNALTARVAVDAAVTALAAALARADRLSAEVGHVPQV
jgi:uncharacterized membrane protein